MYSEIKFSRDRDKELRLSDDDLEKISGSEKLELSILHPIDSWGKIFGKLAEPFKASLDALKSKSHRKT